nr:PREDICTED: esterase B1-like [Linepithema humile]
MVRSSSSAFAVTLCQTTDILTLFSRHPFNIYIMDNNRVNVNVSEGKLIGIITENVYGDKYIAFRGIPYAKPPVGELRFKDPVLPEPWSGDRDASKFGNNAVQLNIFTQQITGNEDCLYLNVYTTNINPEKKRPVMVWIHGGGFYFGSGDDTFYGPDHIVQKDVVLVTLNYRLSVLGFLNLYDKVATGNQGLKDVVMALQWVQKNISNFGGNSKNVTIFGESAGAATVHYLTISPLAEDLFHKAIAQSGAATNPWAFTEREPPSTNKGFQLAAKLGKATTDAKVAYEFLKKIDAKKLIQTEQQSLLTEEKRQQSLVIFTPSMDNESSNPVFPKPINTLINRGIKVPLLVGYTNDEGLLVKSNFSNRGKKEVLEQVNFDFKKAITPRVLSTLPEIPITVEELRSLYFGDKAVSEETLKNYVDFNGDQEFYRGLMEAVDIQIKSGHSSTYLYNFSYENEDCPMRKMMGITLPGVCHAEDLYYLFYPHMIKDLGFLPPELDSEEYKVISRCVQMWTDFAKTGNPTPTITDLIPVKWEPLKTEHTYNYLNIDTELRMKTLRKKEQRWDWKNMKMKL